MRTCVCIVCCQGADQAAHAGARLLLLTRPPHHTPHTTPNSSQQYVVETRFVGEKEMGTAGAEIVDIKVDDLCVTPDCWRACVCFCTAPAPALARSLSVVCSMRRARMHSCIHAHKHSCIHALRGGGAAACTHPCSPHARRRRVCCARRQPPTGPCGGRGRAWTPLPRWHRCARAERCCGGCCGGCSRRRRHAWGTLPRSAQRTSQHSLLAGACTACLPTSSQQAVRMM
jgi:hypothetical protein